LFQELGTPPSEAVLGLDASGSFLIGLEECNSTLKLVQRAVPSSHGRKSASLIQKLPLECPVFINHDDEESSVATIPIEILLSSDSRMGIVRIQNSSTPEDTTGTLIALDLRTGKTAFSPNVRLRHLNNTKTIRNLFWNVTQIPIVPKDSPNWLCRKVKAITSAHVVFNDEDDGYRITWIIPDEREEIAEKEMLLSAQKHSSVSHINSSNKAIHEVNILQREHTWEGCSNLVALEAFLSVEALLNDIRSRRKRVFGYPRVVEYSYELVSMDRSRYVTLVICFANGPEQAIAVVVQFDIFTQTYHELKWGKKHRQQLQSSVHEILLKNWSSQYAFNQRMEDLGVGPFCCCALKKHIDKKDWRHVLDDSQNIISCKNTNPTFWSDFITDPTIHKEHRITIASLYPDCDIFSNAAVRKELPAPVLRCRSESSEIVYAY